MGHSLRTADQPHKEANACLDEKQIFLEAMTDVRPLSRKNIVEKKVGRQRRYFLGPGDPDRESLDELHRLVKDGTGFVVASTPEYMEGTNYNVHPEISRRLHKGRFSIQGHLDLHGFSVAGAEEAFNAFIKQSILAGKRALLIIHGRGLSSPEKPVLKSKVFEWLTYGPWRKWVIAFSSARGCDGGAGATYVLLRKSPVTKKMRKRK
ncbi:MAG: Smr/MutS family protein [Desulfobacterales bacterium]